MSKKFQARRATLDDLPRLQRLWELMRFSDPELERQLTNFQVVTDEAGVVVGCAAFEMTQRQAHLHHEGFEDFGLADYARPALWSRLQTLATNHGLVRLWTQETSPFWSRNGFQPATPENLVKLPPTWNPTPANWLTLKLKDEETFTSLEKEFALFVESEKKQREQLLNRTRLIKTVVIAGIILIVILLIAATAWVFFKQRAAGSGLPH